MNCASKATVLLTALCAIAPASAAERSFGRPEVFTKLIDCRGIADRDQRLACYDAAAGALEEAEKKKDLVVVDRKEIRETKKSLFGFTLPKIGLFGDGDDAKQDEKDEVSELASTVETARPIAGGNWSLRLANDAGTWETTSTITVAPRGGDKVRIKKASLGSYLGQVGMNRGVRFRRVQ